MLSQGPSSFDMRVHFSRGASYLIMQNLGSTAAGILAFVILARLISTTEMGIWAILQLVVAACSTFVTWLPQSVTKFVAENSSGESKSKAAPVFYQALRVNVITYAPVIVGFYFGAPYLASHLLGSVSYANLFEVLAFDVFLNAGALQVVVAALLGLRMFRETAIVGLVAGGIFRQIMVLSFVVLLRNFVGLVVGWLISDALMVAIYLVLIVRVLGGPRFDFPLTRLFRFYWPLELGQIVGFVQSWFDRVLLLLFVPLATLGIYNVALTAYGAAANVSGGMTSMLFPALSSIHQGSKSRTRLRNAIRLGTRYACLTATPIDLILLAAATPALALFVGESYVGGSLPLAIFCAADAVTLFATVLGPTLLALEETPAISVIRLITAVVGLTAAYLLLPGLGIAGASIARASVIILTAILQALILRRKIALRLEFRSVVKTLIAGSAAAALVAAIELVRYSKFLLPAYAFIGVVLYLIMLRGLKAVDADDLELLQRFLGKRFALVGEVMKAILLAHS